MKRNLLISAVLAVGLGVADVAYADYCSGGSWHQYRLALESSFADERAIFCKDSGALPITEHYHSSGTKHSHTRGPYHMCEGVSVNFYTPSAAPGGMDDDLFEERVHITVAGNYELAPGQSDIMALPSRGGIRELMLQPKSNCDNPNISVTITKVN